MNRIRFTQNLGKLCVCVHGLYQALRISSAHTFGEPGNKAIGAFALFYCI